MLQFQIKKQDELLSFAHVIQLWQNSTPFRSYFNALLAEVPFEAFYWEVAPMTKTKTSLPFEFVVIDSAPLRHIIPDQSAFQEYFAPGKAVVDFLNLGKDAHLLAPTPIGNASCYAHLAQFVRHASAAQQNEFWKKVGELYEADLNDQPLWLSTAGLGVSWLHLRLDSRPKYYRYEGYKKWAGF
ncbi:DUF6940 family protein [Haliscomenobacter hydrossis]|uniref:Uncharacterized protein n=1 Tax=Haliscomenobacter hydrossis (strain ATCC 27775 / DSM 1100 / LMG 10767 / O) TaxID=760192 RepID=F4KWI9_HALH1|nr:hypothetical protein [Haliscomenobacter hydrossis]AEE51329.1 hypothetical protein Halhy_3474 [Haliscomenobacter hydrossis DSM 1100]